MIFRPDGTFAPCSTPSTTASRLHHRNEKSLAAERMNTIETASSKGAEATFRDFLRQGEIRLQQCLSCKRFVYYPRDFCHHCHAEQLRWQPISGQGSVYSLTVQSARTEGEKPRNTVLVELDEGVRIVSRVEGMASDRLQIGMRVKARISSWQDVPILVFEPERADD